MSEHPRQLPLPVPVLNNPQSRELVRVWACAGEQQMIIAGKTWEDPAAWGILLVDLAKHVAGCYAAQSSLSRTAALDRIKAGFDVEWTSPTV